jgi:hypothetical protein
MDLSKSCVKNKSRAKQATKNEENTVRAKIKIENHQTKTAGRTDRTQLTIQNIVNLQITHINIFPTILQLQ